MKRVRATQFPLLKLNQEGSLLLSLIVAAAMLSIVLLAVMPAFQAQSSNAQRINLALSASVLRDNLKFNIENAAAWTATKADSGAGACNVDMTCVNSGGTCAGLLDGSPGPKTPEHPINCIYDINGDLAFNSAIATNGFDESGKPCNTWAASPNGDPNCPFRPEIAFQVDQCSLADCTAKPVTVLLRFKFGSKEGVVFNPARFNVTISK